MKATVLTQARSIELRHDLTDPLIVSDADAIVKVALCAICGSDLHPYRGEIPGFMNNCVMGHEFVGEIVDVGREVRGFRPGNTVLASDLIACGSCSLCVVGLHYHCSKSTLFGYGTVVGPYVPGGQAQYVRVPYADHVLKRIPTGVTQEQAIFACDGLTTALAGLRRSGFKQGEDILVVGCGSVGLCTILCARAFGAARVFAIDPLAQRARVAESFGAIISTSVTTAGEWLADQRGEVGIRRVVEAVGTPTALRIAIDAVGPRGCLSVVGAHGKMIDAFDAHRCFIREAELCFTIGNPIHLAEEVLSIIQSGAIDPTPIISHRLPLDEVARAYQMFDTAQAVKIVMLVA